MKTEGMVIPDSVQPGQAMDRPGYGACTLLEIVPKGGNVSSATVRHWAPRDEVPRHALTGNTVILAERADDGRTFLWLVHHMQPRYAQGRK